MTYKTIRGRSFLLPTNAPFSLKRLVFENDDQKNSSLTTELKAFICQQVTIERLDLVTATRESILAPTSLPELRILRGHFTHIHPWLTAQPRRLSHLWVSEFAGAAADHIIANPDHLQSVKFLRCDSRKANSDLQVSLVSSLSNLELLELDHYLVGRDYPRLLQNHSLENRAQTTIFSMPYII